MGLSKELFLEISNEINDLIFILNPEFKIEFINEKSKEIIDLHEGQIWAESAGRDKGCTFTIKLPI